MSHVQNPWVPFAFLTGGFFSGLSGFFGMKTATYASARTANAARNSLNAGLRVAFRSGAVMGLAVASLGLVGVGDCLGVTGLGAASASLTSLTSTSIAFGARWRDCPSSPAIDPFSGSAVNAPNRNPCESSVGI